jgi:hypothetical protein
MSWKRKVATRRSYGSVRLEWPAPTELFEEHAAEILARKLEIIRNGSDTDALRAIEQTESRIYGKPKETVETRSTEIPEQLAEIRAMPFEQKLALLRQLGPIAVPDQLDSG